MKVLDVVERKDLKIDWVLAIALIAALICCLHGISYKYMHPDQMAFRPIFQEGKLPFNPGWFHKPPFHTYFNYFLSVLPISIIEKGLALPANSLDFSRTVWSKLLTAFLLLGSIALAFQITKKTFGLFSARIVALLFATSSGFIAYSHFLTADIPVMFWMLAAFYFSHNILEQPRATDYILSGFLTGIATATKYNGLAIGITIIVAHVLSSELVVWKLNTWKTLFLDKKLIWGLLMIPMGFLLASPFALLDYQTFKADFIYNYTVTPVYDGQTGNSYGKFFSCILEIIGLPAFLIFLVAFLFSLYLVFLSKERNIQVATFLLGLSAFLLYYYKFASFPRLETRFVLPIVPLWLISSGSFWNKLRTRKSISISILIALLAYNLICSFNVGTRFLEDPRLSAETWAKRNISTNSSIESDIYTPAWNSISDVRLNETTMPFIDGRQRLFKSLFGNNPFIAGSEDDQKKEDEKVKWYSLEELMKRAPDYIAVNSLYYKRFFEPGVKQNLYPSMKEFFLDLLDEKYPYKIVFDGETKSPHTWIYPQEIDFLNNRITILARKT